MFHVKHMIKAAFFDFNGTLYFDQDINKITWKKTIDKLSDNKIDFEPFFKDRRSVIDKLVIIDAYKAINKKYSEQEIDFWVDYKEKEYRKYGVDHNRTVLSPGAKEVLDYIKSKNIPIILCTSSIIENVDYYFKEFNLDRWFKREQTVYDDGNYASKAQMYKKCADICNVRIEESIIFEDSLKSIKQAIEAGAKTIVSINNPESINQKEIVQNIKDFRELDYSLFD